MPDEQIPATTVGLSFITDPELRDSIRADIAFADRALSGGEWKAVTVLAGAVAEALLLWAINTKDSEEISRARERVDDPKPKANPDHWGLEGYIKVGRELRLIEDNTARQGALAKDFRNLIHPGRSARLNEVCGRGTAHAALAAVDFVVRDLSRNLGCRP